MLVEEETWLVAVPASFHQPCRANKTFPCLLFALADPTDSVRNKGTDGSSRLSLRTRQREKINRIGREVRANLALHPSRRCSASASLSRPLTGVFPWMPVMQRKREGYMTEYREFSFGWPCSGRSFAEIFLGIVASGMKLSASRRTTS